MSIPLTLLSALLLAVPTGAAAAPAVLPDGLSATISDGVETASPGDVLRYVAEVENSGSETFTGFIRLDLPTFVEVSIDGEAHGSAVSWPIELAPGESESFGADAIVGEPTTGAYQVVALAGVKAEDGTVVVRAADADLIPGAEAPPAVPGLAAGPDGMSAWVPALAGGAVVVLAVAAAVVIVRRRLASARAREDARAVAKPSTGSGRRRV